MIKPSEKAAALIEGIQAFVRDELDALVKREGIVWGEPVAKPLLRQVWQRSCELGFYNVMLPEALGGAGLNVAELCAVKEAAVLTGCPLAPHILGELSGPPRIGHLFKVANEHQIEAFLRPVCRAEKAVCFALTEAEAGSDATAISTSAQLDGDHYVLNGAKRYISGATYADVAVLLAVTEPGRGPKGISAFFVDLHADGVRVESDYAVMSGGGAHGNIVLENVRVPVDNRIGDAGEGFKLAMGRITLNRLLHCPTMLGMAGLALNLSLDYARTRKQFGRPISDFQMIRAKLADMYVWVESMRLFTYQALRAANDMEVGGGGRGSIHKITAASVMYAAETMNKVLNEAVQIHGGTGYIWESEINRLYRSIKLLEIGAGTTEVRKIIISEEMLND